MMATLRTSIVTFNCGKSAVDPEALAPHLLSSTTQSDLLVLSLQEIAPLAQSFIGGSFVHPFLRRIWKAVKLASGDRKEYDYVLARNIGTTAIMLFAVPEIRARIHDLEIASTAVGHYDLGNKGAIAVRFTYAANDHVSRTLTFVAAHLTPMETDYERRNQDWEVITRTLVFDSSTRKQPHQATLPEERETLLNSSDSRRIRDTESGIYEKNSLLFIAGDLNYRTRDVKPQPQEHMTFPQPGDSLHIWSKGDQLDRERAAGNTMQALTEASIHFPPTYKYALDVPSFRWPHDGSEPEVWHWAQHRFPSWCDRILYSEFASTGLVKVTRYAALPLMPSSDHRPVTMDVEIDMEGPNWASASETEAPFSIDPAWKSRKATGRRLELAVGVFAYLGMTWEGNGIILAGIIGAFGGYAVLSSLVTAHL